MSREWKLVRLDDCTEQIFSGGTPSTKIKEYWNGKYSWLSSGETRNVFITTTEKTITKEGIDKSSTKLAKKYDIVIASAGQGNTRGQVSLCKIDTYINQSIIAVRSIRNNLEPYFLFYNLKSRYSELRKISDGHSIRGSLTTKIIRDLKILLPPLEEQKAIANILSTLDEKIEINNQINKKLEKMAQTIFKHWFVDFEFPNENGEPYKSSGGEMIESELGMIPKGWEVDNIGNLVKEIVTGKTPSTKAPDNYGNKYPFITIPDMHNNVFIIKTERYLSEKGNKVQINKLLPANSINVSCIATVGLVAINAKPAHTNQQINSIIPNRDEDVYYFYEYLKLMSDKLKAIGSTGSTTLNVNKGEFEKMKYIYPQRQVMIRFNNLIKSNFEMIKKKQLENEKLKELNDTLLPKLMSGEIRVPIDN